MDTVAPIPFPHGPERAGEDDEAAARALAEVDVAIALVARGAAVRVRLGGLSGAAQVAAAAASHAQQAGVGFRLEPGPPGRTALTVGPRLRPG